MKQEIKSGKEVLDTFMTSLKENEDLDTQTVNAVTDLYENNKLTKTNLINALSDLRDKHETE
ncbi:MAG: hypothetical protein GC136_01045 [Alphaproteobacteria bacterium]|nr:hypothetical protein [Alphaproteobacteria bacterium]